MQAHTYQPSIAALVMDHEQPYQLSRSSFTSICRLFHSLVAFRLCRDATFCMLPYPLVVHEAIELQQVNKA